MRPAWTESPRTSLSSSVLWCVPSSAEGLHVTGLLRTGKWIEQSVRCRMQPGQWPQACVSVIPLSFLAGHILVEVDMETDPTGN